MANTSEKHLGLCLQDDPLHFVVEKTYMWPTYCVLCGKLLLGLVKQGVKCQLCGKDFHRECFRKTPDVCTGMLLNVGNSRDSGVFWQGYLAYFQDFNEKVHVNYWQLTKDRIRVFKAFNLEKKLHDIALSEVVAVTSDACMDSVTRSRFPHEAKVHLKTDEVYFHCGLKNKFSNLLDAAANFYNMLNLVYLPYNKENRSRKSFKISAPKYEERKIEEDIAFTDLIGKGGFGKVVGGVNRSTRQSVAVKQIEASNVDFMPVNDLKYQSEVSILCNMKHQGIVKLEALYHDGSYLYIVMERLELNLSWLIKEQEDMKLPEYVTKFISFQIFVALDFLHENSIAHCDLKPENIMLLQRAEYPQVKLVDFGYSKIIGLHSFRKSIMGTFIYNPPEVQEGRIYNKQVDMWAMGVVIFNCLSGRFPFYDNVSLEDQLNDPSFFPADVFTDVSNKATTFIKTGLLQLLPENRSTLSKILQNIWFTEDTNLVRRVQELEAKVGATWLMTYLK